MGFLVVNGRAPAHVHAMIYFMKSPIAFHLPGYMPITMVTRTPLPPPSEPPSPMLIELSCPDSDSDSEMPLRSIISTEIDYSDEEDDVEMMP